MIYVYPERYIKMAEEGEHVHIVLDNERDSKKELILTKIIVFD